jgi:hypothetical protein
MSDELSVLTEVLIKYIHSRRCNNFQSDISDSEIYSHLLKQIAPADSNVTLEALLVSS